MYKGKQIRNYCKKGTVSFKLGVFYLTASLVCLFYFSVSDAISAPIIIDNTDSGFSRVGSWTTYSCSACYGSNYLVTSAGSGSKKATWTFQIGAPGEYEISAQWVSKFDRATNAPYTIKNNTTTLATVFVDQTVNGGQFNLLGTYTLEAGTLQVILTDNANGRVVADATQIVLQVNQAPNGVIDTPGGNVTINVGETVSFTGTGNDPDNNLPLSYLWNFGDPAIADSTLEDPGQVQFNNEGTFTVTLTVTDSLGLPDPTPDTRTITVQGAPSNQAPNGVIDTLGGDVTINVGDTVSFTGTGNDPDNNLPLSYLWNFGDPAIADSTLEDPGQVQFNNEGTFTVTLTVTDSLGLSDPTPDTRTVTVQAPNQAPNGVIDSPSENVTINVGDTVSFAGTGSDPDGNVPLSYLWNFGDPVIADSTQEDPGVVQFNNEGTFTVTFTVTDSLGLPDPIPAQIVVDVVSPAVIIVDNTDPGFSKVGSWSTYLCGACYGANYFVTGAGTGSKKATWTFQISAPGEYEISAQWVSKFDRATNAPYTIKNNTTALATVFVDQTVNGGQFHLLGTYTLEAGTLQVTLTNNANGKVVADAVRITASQGFGIISPSDLDLKTSQDVLVEALVVGFPPGWGVEFTVTEKDSGNIIQRVEDYNRPFELQLSGLSLQEYTVDALLIDQNGVFQSPFSDQVEFGVGDYYVGLGDSITRGSGDNVTSDNVSTDGRNSGGGYEPILNNLLTTNKGYPHTVKNEGVSGNLSIDGLNRVPTVLSNHPDSQYLLILFGTNDAKSTPPVPSGMGLNPGDSGYAGTFKDNMQRIIDAVINEGKIPLLAKVPYALGSNSNGTPFPDPDAAPQNILIQEYNVVIDELIGANNIRISPPDLFVAPDLYNHFRNNYLNNGASEYADNLHPNGTGYQSIANLWKNSISPGP